MNGIKPNFLSVSLRNSETRIFFFNEKVGLKMFIKPLTQNNKLQSLSFKTYSHLNVSTCAGRYPFAHYMMQQNTALASGSPHSQLVNEVFLPRTTQQSTWQRTQRCNKKTALTPRCLHFELVDDVFLFVYSGPRVKFPTLNSQTQHQHDGD